MTATRLVVAFAALLVLASAATNIDDRQALVCFRESILNNGGTWPSFGSLATWNDPALLDPCDEWDGVTCTGDRVTTVAFSEPALRGPIPSCFFNLPELRTLSISSTILFGPLVFDETAEEPLSFLYRMTNLEILNLPNNGGFTGPLPSWEAAASTITQVNLRDCDFSGPVNETLMQASPNLATINFGNNELSGPLPAESICNMPQLQLALLYGNDFTGRVTQDFSSCASAVTLDTLQIHNNNLWGALPDLSAMVSLTELKLQDNEFCDLPSSHPGSAPWPSPFPPGTGLGTPTLEFDLDTCDCCANVNWIQPDAPGCGACVDPCDLITSCDDGNSCTDEGGCIANEGVADCQITINDANNCDADDLCYTGDTCTNGVCGGGTPIDCDDGDACTDESDFDAVCAEGICLNLPVCSDHGTCIRAEDPDVCVCEPGFGGDYCQDGLGCALNCRNGGECGYDEANDFAEVCVCTDGFTGPLCEDVTQSFLQENLVFLAGGGAAAAGTICFMCVSARMRKSKAEEKKERKRERKHKKKLRDAERKHRASMEKLEKQSMATNSSGIVSHNTMSMASINTAELEKQGEALAYREMALAKQQEAAQYAAAAQYVAATNVSAGSPPGYPAQQMMPSPQYVDGDMISLASDATAPVEENRHLPKHARPADAETIAPWFPPADSGFVPVATTSPQIPQQPQMVLGSDGTSMGSGMTQTAPVVPATPAQLMAAHTQANGGYNVTDANPDMRNA